MLSEQQVRNLPPGTELTDPYNGERLALVEHTDLDGGWWLSDGSWMHWKQVAEYLAEG